MQYIVLFFLLFEIETAKKKYENPCQTIIWNDNLFLFFDNIKMRKHDFTKNRTAKSIILNRV